MQTLRLMESEEIPDQDAIQLILTGHYQMLQQGQPITNVSYQSASDLKLSYNVLDRSKFLHGDQVWWRKRFSAVIMAC